MTKRPKLFWLHPRYIDKAISLLDGVLNYCLPILPTVLKKNRKRRPPIGLCPRILIVRADAVGDFVMFSAFLREVRANYKTSKICLVTTEQVAGIADACPYIDELKVLPKRNGKFAASYLPTLRAFAREHLEGRFDLAIQPRWDNDRDWATLTARLSQAPRVVGFTEKTTTTKAWINCLYDRMLTDVVPRGCQIHEADRNLDVLRYLGGSISSNKPEFWVSEADHQKAAEYLAQYQRPKRDAVLIAFGIGAMSPRRKWPFYADLIKLLSAEVNFVPILIAGPLDDQYANDIKRAAPESVIMLAKPLGQVGAVLSKCDLFVGNDSGPLHIAAATGVPVVEISCHPKGGHTENVNSPSRFGPLTPEAVIIRPDSFLGRCFGGCLETVPHCITLIEPIHVLNELRHLIRQPYIEKKKLALKTGY